MSDLSARTLMVAIRAVHAEARRLEAERAMADPGELSLLEEDLFAVSKAEAELRRVYEELQRSADNLPLYERLLR